MRLLLDEGFPSPIAFDIAAVDGSTDVVALRDFDRSLVGMQTPDWYLYLRAGEEGFDALVTHDWHQSQQPEELWALTRTELSVVTWRKPMQDPMREWGQLLAYLPEVRRILDDLGPCVVLLPSPRLQKTNIAKASDAVGQIAAALSISNQELRYRARSVIERELAKRGESTRFSSVVD